MALGLIAASAALAFDLAADLAPSNDPAGAVAGLPGAAEELRTALETASSGATAEAADGSQIMVVASFRDGAGRPCREFEVLRRRRRRPDPGRRLPRRRRRLVGRDRGREPDRAARGHRRRLRAGRRRRRRRAGIDARPHRRGHVSVRRRRARADRRRLGRLTLAPAASRMTCAPCVISNVWSQLRALMQSKVELRSIVSTFRLTDPAVMCISARWQFQPQIVATLDEYQPQRHAVRAAARSRRSFLARRRGQRLEGARRRRCGRRCCRPRRRSCVIVAAGALAERLLGALALSESRARVPDRSRHDRRPARRRARGAASRARAD